MRRVRKEFSHFRKKSAKIVRRVRKFLSHFSHHLRIFRIIFASFAQVSHICSRTLLKVIGYQAKCETWKIRFGHGLGRISLSVPHGVRWKLIHLSRTIRSSYICPIPCDVKAYTAAVVFHFHIHRPPITVGTRSDS